MSLESLVPRFQFIRVLDSCSVNKRLVLLGQIDGQDAILSLEKCHFNLSNPQSIPSQISQFLTDATNDVYVWGVSDLKSILPDSPDLKVRLIFPATETHIKKYNTQNFRLVKETPELYQKYVVPYIDTMTGERLQWVRNILFEGAEAERVVFRQDGSHGFVLLPDMKWDGLNLEHLYLVAIVNREDIRSLRDLNSTHIEYLQSLESGIQREVSTKYGLASDKLRLFVHYHPSYYHFHIHVTNIEHSGLGAGVSAGKAVLLDEIIDQLRWLGPEGFTKKTISHVLGENHKLWSIIKDHL